MNKICYGCGIKLQTKDKNNLGYTPKEDAIYCMRCFRMINYGESSTSNTPKDSKEIINKINKDTRFVIFLVDFLNVNKEVINIFKSIKKRKVLVINKCELMPKHVNKNKYLNYIKKYYEISDPIKLKGGKENRGASSIKKYLSSLDIREAYILGLSNSGKSTLINDLASVYGSKVSKITVSKKANTTLDFIRVKISDDLLLIDSPGFIIDNYIDKDDKNENIVAYTYNMNECQTLSLYDKFYFKFSNKSPITFYLKEVKKGELKKIYKAVDGLKTKIEIKPNTDINIYGIGFIHIKEATTITTNIDLTHIEVRDSIFGGNYE